MAPKKVGKKKDEVVELPKTSSLPDGAKTYFVGGWSAHHTLGDLKVITDAVRPTTPEDELTAGAKQIYVLPGVMGNAQDSLTAVLCHGMQLTGLSTLTSRTNAAAYDAKKANGGAAAVGGDDGAAVGDGEGNAEGNAAAAAEVWGSDVDESVVIGAAVVFEGIRPTVTVAPIITDVKPAAPEKGAKKKSEEEKQRELEAQRQREEAAIQAAKDEEERLNRFAMPNRWATVTISNVVFAGPVKVRQIHLNFKNCRFTSPSAKANQVEVTQYCRVTFTNCTFEAPRKSALYCFPQSDVTVKKSAFTGGDSSEVPAGVKNAVGLHTDGAKILVDHCSFTRIGTGVLLRGSVAPAAAAASGGDAAADAGEKSSTLKPGASTQVVQSCKLTGLFTSGLVVDKASYTLFHRNEVQDCGYYGAQIVNGGAKNFVMNNNFSSLVHIGVGSKPILSGNTLNFPIKDENDGSNVYMQPVY